MKAYSESRSIAVPIVNFGTRWRWFVNFTRRLRYTGERTRVPIKLQGGWAPERIWTILEFIRT